MIEQEEDSSCSMSRWPSNVCSCMHGTRLTANAQKKGASFRKLLRERETGIEPATLSLARRCSTAEPLAHILLSCDNRMYDIIWFSFCQPKF